eukprot:TRINITY_DN2086_c0_g2_i3.p1 TRINITY_DN2086_c0_g2~~TRINITY_DN2086_c0_g2_i3.p1  ORF type:complete len:885 (-),score=225.09 TRINITY_DN2086_c0_g2_i3:170-2824(-)
MATPASIEADLEAIIKAGMGQFNPDLLRAAEKVEVKKYDEKGIRLLVDGLPTLKLKVQLLDSSMSDLIANPDWTVKDCLGVIAGRQQLGDHVEMFHLQEHVASRTPPGRWLRRECTLQEESVQSLSKVLFRMRWPKIPRAISVPPPNPLLVTQFYHHLVYSFITENTPIDRRHALQLASLQLYVTLGNYDPAKVPPGTIEKNLGTYVAECVVKEGGVAPDGYEKELVPMWSEHKGKPQVDAMMEYIRRAQEVPTFGACMYDVQGAGRAPRRLALLDDGLAVFFGRVDDFTYVSYKDVEVFEISPEDPNLLLINHFATADRRSKETIKIFSVQADAILTQACGFYHLLSEKIAVPAMIPRSTEVPANTLFVCRQPRDDIIRFQSRLEYLKETLLRQFKAAQRSPPPKLLAQVTACLETGKNLDALDCSGCELEDKGLQALATAFDTSFKFRTKVPLVENVTLTSIDLSFNPIRDHPGSILAIKTLLSLPLPIKNIQLRKIDVTSKAGGQLGDALRSGKSLEVVNLSLNESIGSTATEILRHLKGSKTLSSLSFAGCRLSGVAGDLYEFIRQTDSITSLNLCGSNIGEDGIEKMVPAIQASKLSELNLNECGIGAKGSSILLRALAEKSTISKLSIADNQAKDDFAEMLAKCWAAGTLGNLTYLDLSINEMSTTSIEFILKSLQLEVCKLSELLMNSCVLKSSFNKMLMKAVATDKLTRLELRSCYLAKGSIEAVCELIKKTHIRKVDLAFNPINGGLVKLLCEGLSTSTTLDMLNIAQCSFSTKELLSICDALCKCPSLKIVRLDGNKLSAQILTKLSDFVRQSKSLTLLGLSEVEVGSKDLVDFVAKLSLPLTVKSIDLRGNRLMPIQFQEHITRLAGVDIMLT